jgi:parallel beta-helix repeat protein
VLAGVALAGLFLGFVVYFGSEWFANSDSEQPEPETTVVATAPAITTGAMNVFLDKTLGNDHFGQIFIEASDVTLDCAGHTISGASLDPNWSGIHVNGRSGVTIRNCFVDDFNAGFEIKGSSDNTFENNTISNVRQGFTLLGSDSNTLFGNRVVGASDWFGYGLFEGSDGNELRENSATAVSGVGFMIQGSNNNVFANNDASGNYGNGLGANPPSSGNTYAGNTATNNTNHDFEDNTSGGTGDAGTDNTYTDNICDGRSSPRSLC